MGHTPKVAVLGAGMGGLTLGSLLARKGVEVVVYEQAPAFGRVGAGIQISPNAVRVLRALDLEPYIRGVAFQPRYWRNREWDTGHLKFELELGETAEKSYGAPYLLAHRADLHGALLSRLPTKNLMLGKKLVGVDDNGLSVQMSFEDGTHAQADILIASDGIHSQVREILFGAEDPQFTGRVAYRTVFPAKLLRGELEDNVKWWGQDRHIVIYYVNPRRDEVYFVTSVPDPSWTIESWSAKADMRELRESFVGFDASVRHVLDVCPQAHKWAIADRHPMASWAKGRIGLIGDACHPMTPYMAQGAAQAMEDALILSRILQQTAFEDLEHAWRLFESARQSRTARIQTISHNNTWMRDKTDSSWLYGYDPSSVDFARTAT
jgi:6-hydroxynicotinate 3-monooxygenase